MAKELSGSRVLLEIHIFPDPTSPVVYTFYTTLINFLTIVTSFSPKQDLAKICFSSVSDSVHSELYAKNQYVGQP